MSSVIYQGLFFLFILLALALPLGWYIKEIMQGKIPKGFDSFNLWSDCFIRLSDQLVKRNVRKALRSKYFIIKYFINHIVDRHFNDTTLYAWRFIREKFIVAVSIEHGC